MGTVVVDAGVVIAVLDGSDAHHAAAVRTLVATRERHEMILPAAAYAEVMVHPAAAGPQAVSVADGLIDALPARVEPVTREIAREAAALRARHGPRLRLPDSLVIGTAVIVGADRIVTTDTGWPELALPVDVVGGA